MRNLILVISISFLICSQSMAAKKYFGTGLCQHPDFFCAKVNVSGWQRAFPDQIQRDIVQKVNRTYNSLWKGKIIAVPKNLDKITILDVSPLL